MTREPEILLVTLEEALLALGESDLWLESTQQGRWVVFQEATDGYFTRSPYCKTWPEAVTAALGRKVVARDEAAELRAAVTEWTAADLAWGEARPGEAYDVAEARFEAASNMLRRLVDVGEQSLGSDR